MPPPPSAWKSKRGGDERLVIDPTVRRTIGPLERIAARWNERSHASLDPMPAEQREAMFERFVRGPEPGGEGTGLGLAIVREIALLHGAEVQLGDSQAGGESVTIRFPALEAAVPTTA